MSQEFNDKIDNYLEGKLNQNDLDAFEQALKTDPTLVRAIEVSRLEKKGIELLVETDLRAKLQRWKSEKEPQKPSNTEGIKNYRYVYIGVFIATILFIGLYFFNQQKPINVSKPKNNDLDTLLKGQKSSPTSNPIINQTIPSETKEQKPIAKIKENPMEKDDKTLAFVNSMYDKPDFSNSVRHTNKEISDTLKSLIEAWENNDFKQVISLSESIDKSNKNYYRSQEILGHAFFRLNQFDKAENTFKIITLSAKGQIIEDSNWYRLLCLIALKQNDDATILLNIILSNKNHTHFLDAKKLLDFWQK
jgi:hypothetical protein